MKPVVIIGAGGLGLEVLAIIQAINAQSPTWDVIGFLDDDPSPERTRAVTKEGLEILGRAQPETSLPGGCSAVVAIGTPTAGLDIVRRLQSAPLEWTTLVHPDTTIGPHVSLGSGVHINAGARLSRNIVVGNHVQIDQNATVAHDVRLGDHARLSPQACVNGNVRVGEEVLIGANATVLQGLRIGAGGTVAAGAVATRGTLPGSTVRGVPAR